VLLSMETARQAGAPRVLIDAAVFGYYEPQHRRGARMQKWVCTVCGYLYDPEKGDPENGVAPGTPFEKLPADWMCPVCGAQKEDFEKSSD
jgi:rubredoxin